MDIRSPLGSRLHHHDDQRLNFQLPPPPLRSRPPQPRQCQPSSSRSNHWNRSRPPQAGQGSAFGWPTRSGSAPPTWTSSRGQLATVVGSHSSYLPPLVLPRPRWPGPLLPESASRRPGSLLASHISDTQARRRDLGPTHVSDQTAARSA